MSASHPTSEGDDQSSSSDDEDKEAKPMSEGMFAGLKFRSIGPAVASGRICDFAVDPQNHAHYFVAVCSGGVWKTDNAGITYEPVFDGEGSYSVGCVAMDPHNPNVVWVGSGENNSQRSVSFGDGVYRTRDGGKSWENLGLKESEHIGNIVIDPRDSNVVYVAAQGPLWRSGGDRGLYKTIDGGKTWERVLHVSEDTGINEVHMDPRNPDVLYATSYQRRRHVWTLIDGGPEGAIYKSEDAGKSWRKLKSGIPGGDKGRIGMCVSPADPDVVYAIIEGQDEKSTGVYRSEDRGETWKKRSAHSSTSPQYYNELVCDPLDKDTLFSLDTFTHVSTDGGKTFSRTSREHRHVDDHALWIDPKDTNHMLMGCDGGIYETYDRMENWEFKDNLPVSQFYRVSLDNSEPFYYVYGGTQDNNSMGGPSRTRNPGGIGNEDWFVTVGGDGYENVVDPEDPNVVYGLWQYGGLVRFDRKNGEVLDIKPREKPGEDTLKWNWDTPLIISPHSHTRLYVAAQKLYRSDDRGNSWTCISDDLTRKVDRNQLQVMGKIWSVDAVAKNASTSVYGNCVALNESPLVEGLIYVGSDDGVISITEDAGKTWRRVELFPGIPDSTYVSFIWPSQHDADTVYASFDNHKQGDFKPYILKSVDRGKTWKSITGDLPDRQIVYNVTDDHGKADLLFAGTEFGVYFTPDGGEKWIRLKGGLPTIAVRDMAVQKRENDLVLATFGRSFYVLDDYSPLRLINKELLDKDAVLFPVKNALRYVETSRLGGFSGKGSQGASFYLAPNPSFGATFTYYIKEKLVTRQEKRKEAEKKAGKGNKPSKYPTIDELRAEDEEREPQVFLVVTDDANEIVRRIQCSRDKGVHRATWDLRYPSPRPVQLRSGEDLPPWIREPAGPMALPGTYTAMLYKEVDGKVEQIGETQKFDVVPLDLGTFPAENRADLLAFNRETGRLQRAVLGAMRTVDETQTKLAHIRKAILDTPGLDPGLLADVDAVQKKVTDIQTKLSGDRTLAKHEEPVPPSINERLGAAIDWYVTSAPTQTQRDQFKYAGDDFKAVLTDLRTVVDKDMKDLDEKLEQAGAPWTPGRLPTWERE